MTISGLDRRGLSFLVPAALGPARSTLVHGMPWMECISRRNRSANGYKYGDRTERPRAGSRLTLPELGLHTNFITT